jgi:hypothetical protein
MNLKERIIFLVLMALFGMATWLSYRGYGIASEKDPLYIRQEAANNNRSTQGGGTRFGK